MIPIDKWQQAFGIANLDLREQAADQRAEQRRWKRLRAAQEEAERRELAEARAEALRELQTEGMISGILHDYGDIVKHKGINLREYEYEGLVLLRRTWATRRRWGA